MGQVATLEWENFSDTPFYLEYNFVSLLLLGKTIKGIAQ